MILIEARISGVTIAAAWQPGKRVVLEGSWTASRDDLSVLESDTGSGAGGFSAQQLRHPLRVGFSFEIARGLELASALYLVSGAPSGFDPLGRSGAAAWSADLSLIWKPRRDLELGVVQRNLRGVKQLLLRSDGSFEHAGRALSARAAWRW